MTLSKPIPANLELLALLEKAKLIKMTSEMQHAQRRSGVIGQMLLSHPEMTQKYAVGMLDGIEQTHDDPPHVVAETIAEINRIELWLAQARIKLGRVWAK